MRAIPTSLPGLLLIEPTVFRDPRGCFFETFNRRRFQELTGVAADFVQDNQSSSGRNVLRGLHYQIRQPQGKLVRVMAGTVLDVVVDLRRSSPTFGRWNGCILSGENRLMAWIPPGFAHGFVVRSDHAECLYKTTEYWAPEHERCIAWNDPTLAIDWGLTAAPIVSPKDARGAQLLEAEVFA